MDCKNRIIKLRESTGLNRKDFCKLVHIPYRTMTEWELDNRQDEPTPPEWIPDGMHPTPEGYRLLLESTLKQGGYRK